MIKKIYASLLAIGMTTLLFFTACNDFEDLNTDPSKAPVIDPNSQLTHIQLFIWGDWLMTEPYNMYFSTLTQHMQGEWNQTQYGGQYRRNNNVMGQTWNRAYGYAIKNLEDILANTQDDPAAENIHSVARIIRTYYFQILTDMYGDIPYFEAGKGYTADIVNPSYNKQELIYRDMLKELKEAEEALNDEGGTLTGDIIYSGNIQKWKRFANSMRLRMAMRLVKVDPDWARSEIIAVAGVESGFLTNNDNAVIEYMEIFDWDTNEIRRNSMAQIWRGRETFPLPYICSTFWNHLKDTSDPRLLRLCRTYDETDAATSTPWERIDLTDEMVTKFPDLSKFQPSNPGFFWYEKWPSGYQSELTKEWEDKSCRPQVNTIFLKGDTPGILMTYAEVQFLLSEAKVRWGDDVPVAGSAADLYSNAVTAAMELLSIYKLNTITSEEIQTYKNANPFPANSEARLKVINEQLWVLHLNNSPEAFANWRRSGYPELLSSVKYEALTIESETIPRRMNYPLSELSYNKESYLAALEAMGGSDNWNYRVWWDKE